MTEYSSKTLRAAMKAKASRLASGSDATKIGASTFTPAEALNADVQTGARPLTRRRFKSGGKVVGASNAPRADKKKRGNADLSADSFINRNVVEANEEREGKKHIGAFKSGGRAKHATEGKVKDVPVTSPKHPMNKDISTRSVTGPGGRYITGEETRTGVNPSTMPPTMPDDIRASRNAEAAASANANMGKKRGGKAEANCGSGRAKKAGGGPMERASGMGGSSDQEYTDPSKFDWIGMGENNPMMNVRPFKAMYGAMNQMQYDKMRGVNGGAGGGDVNHKSGGKVKSRAKKFMGGPMMQPGGMMGGAAPAMDNRDKMVSKNRMDFGGGPSGSPYKKGGKVPFEGSAKDEAQDTKLAKKYGMSMMAWEKSKQDKKHDEQESTAGLKKGGRAKKADGGQSGKMQLSPYGEKQRRLTELKQQMLRANSRTTAAGDWGDMQAERSRLEDDIAEGSKGMKGMGRAKRARGGKAGKGKTNINIVIATGKGQQDGMMPDNGGMPPKMPSPAMPVQAAPAAGMPPMAGAGAPAPQMPAGAPPMPAGMDKMMPRKAGGRVYKSYKDMDAGSGSGLGRLEKTEIAKRTAHKHGGKTYKSYKDMDAGAASGMGRLEKTEIAARGR